MKVSVIIPLFNNACRELLNCLAGINKQTILPEEVIIVSNTPLKLPVYNFSAKTITIKKPVSMATAINTGLKLIKGDIVCFTDPYTIPYENWIQKIIETYKSDKNIGAVGGMDEIYRYNKLVPPKSVKHIGKLTFYGRLIGNHHSFVNTVEEIDFLKGSNMSFRKDLMTNFDEQIIGFYWWEQPVCLKIKSSGHKLIYNPDIKIKHFKNKDLTDTEKAIFLHSKNTTYLILKYGFKVRKPLFLFYTFLIGQTHSPGILKATFSAPLINCISLLVTSMRGKVRGIRLFLSTKNKI
jgi:GT2 family glycosyltransferase